LNDTGERSALFREAGLQVFERGWLSSNNVLFTSAEAAYESVLVDTGYASHAAQTVALVRHALGGVRQLDRVVNTHLHSDHCGGNHALQRTFGCAIDVPAGEAAKVDAWDESALTYAATGQICPRFRRTGSVRAGDELKLATMTWQVLAAPGHDPESVVLFQPDLCLLVSADALWANGFGVVFPELVGEPGFDDVQRTLQLLASLPVRCVIPGHGAPFDDYEAALERAFKRLRGFAADPAKHARHAAKVLIKFRMLEIQSCALDELDGWLTSTAYLELARSRYFPATDPSAWHCDLLTDLVTAGALTFDGSLLRNV